MLPSLPFPRSNLGYTSVQRFHHEVVLLGTANTEAYGSTIRCHDDVACQTIDKKITRENTRFEASAIDVGTPVRNFHTLDRHAQRAQVVAYHPYPAGRHGEKSTLSTRFSRISRQPSPMSNPEPRNHSYTFPIICSTDKEQPLMYIPIRNSP